MAGPTLDERRVRYLYEAVLTGSVRAAADKMDLNPSVVSRQIAQLESQLAVTLLERHGRGVRPTDAGQVLVDYHRRQAASQDDALAQLQAIRGLAKGHVDLALGEGFVSDLMGEPLQALWRRHPGLTVALNLGGTNDVLRMVEEDTAHIGLVYIPPIRPGIRSHVAVRQPLCAIVAPDHPLARVAGPLTLRQVAAHPLALMHEAYGTRQIVQIAAQMDKVRLTLKLTTNSMSVIKHFAQTGQGVSLLPAFALSQDIGAGEVLALPVDQPLLAKAEAHLITRLGRQLSPAANQLLMQLLTTMKALL